MIRYRYNEDNKERNEMNTAKLRNWKIVNMGDYYKLSGDIYNDSRKEFTDGETVITSKLKSIDFDLHVASTMNTFYELQK